MHNTCLVPLYLSSLLLVEFVGFVSPGANDLHFNDGASSVDIVAGDVFFEVLDPPELKYSYRIRPAKDFGATFNESQIFKGAHLVPTVPLHSCNTIENVGALAGHIALAERGQCSFVFKTLMAQQAGARALIISEFIDDFDDPKDMLIEMMDDKMQLEVNIPAAFLLGTNGVKILRTLRRLKKPYAIVNLPVNMTYVSVNQMNQPPWVSW